MEKISLHLMTNFTRVVKLDDESVWSDMERKTSAHKGLTDEIALDDGSS